jgi:tetratricopeptide (TPR) repeat protein
MKRINLFSIRARRTGAALLLLAITGLLTTAQVTAAASPSELLEQGIYSEETKGDVDGALKLYQQVVTEAKAGQAVAAQAQYRLGICYYKKKNYAEANAAFEKLVKDYPDQKDLIALANKYLVSAMPLMPAPWVDGEELQLDIKFPAGLKIGTAAYRMNAGENNGQKIWRLGMRLMAATSQQFSRVEVEADSFKPIHCRWKVDVIGEVDVTYLPGHAELKMVGQDEVKKIDLSGVVYDNEEVAMLIRRLPLASDYKTTVHTFTGLGGGNIIPVQVAVTGSEKLEVPAGTFDCYKVELSFVGQSQSFWYSTDAHHYLVQFKAGGVIAVLAAVTQRKAGDPVQYQDPTFGFSLAAPADWLFHRPDTKDEKNKVRVLILDPDGTATTVVSVGNRKLLSPEAQQSLRAWAEKEIAQGEGRESLKELQIRPDSWKDRTVAGKPGLSLIGDYVEADEKKIGYVVFTLGNTNAAMFGLLARAKDFEAFRPKFEAIVDSYKEK